MSLFVDSLSLGNVGSKFRHYWRKNGDDTWV
jgi:hypothetical protein